MELDSIRIFMDSIARFMLLSEQSLGVIPCLALVLSLVIAVALERAVFFRRAGWAARMIERTLPTVDMRQDALLRQLATRFRTSFLAQALQAISEASHLERADDMDRYVDEAIARTLPSLDKRLWLIEAAVTLGPLLGALGAVIGASEAVNAANAAGLNLPAVASGLRHALSAAGCGLAVAIVSAAAKAYFAVRVRACALQLDRLKLTSVKRLCLMKRLAARSVGDDDTPASAMVPLKRVANGKTAGA
jgi:biopolymer transport protein ExbB